MNICFRRTRSLLLPVVFALSASLSLAGPNSGRDLEGSFAQMTAHGFEENRGQIDSAVRFFLRDRKNWAGFTADGIVFVMGADSIRMELAGAGADATPSGVGPLPNRTHYIRGKEATSWVTNVRHYRQIVYEDVYPGWHTAIVRVCFLHQLLPSRS